MWTRVEPTAGGASSDVDGIFEDEPMCMLTTVSGLRAGGEERVPVVVGIVDGGKAEERGDLGEAHGPDAALGVAADLGGGQLGVPEGDEGEGDETAFGLGAPVVDHPVVVGLHAEQGQLLVLRLVEGLTAEAGEGREAEGRLEVVGVHVLEPGLHLVANRAACPRR